MWKKWVLCLSLGMGLAPGASAEAAGPTIDEVWMRHGGARLYYDALMEPRQMELKGARRKDPALLHNLPPIVEVKPQATRRKSTRPAASAKSAAAGQATQATAPATGLPAGQAVSPRPSVEAAAQNSGSVPAKPGSAAGGTVNGPSKVAPGSLLPAQSANDVFVPPPASAPAVPVVQAGGTAAGTSGSAAGAGSASRAAGNGERTGAAATAPRPSIPAGERP